MGNPKPKKKSQKIHEIQNPNFFGFLKIQNSVELNFIVENVLKN
jgi:hypothetical protein